MMRAFRSGRLLAAMMPLLLVLTGCDELLDGFKTDNSRFLAPHQPIKAPDRPMITPIRSSVSVADETQDLIPAATAPSPDDFVYTEVDYIIGPTDVLDITILDLYVPGGESVLRREVSDSGFIDLPLLPERIYADGLTTEELRLATAQAYQQAGILRQAQVTVSVVARRQNTFSVLGAVARTGTYNILRRDMSLLEALALAGDVTQPVKYIYVFRRTRPRSGEERSQRPDELGPLPEAVPPSPQQPQRDEIPSPVPPPPPQEPSAAPEQLDAQAELERLSRALGAPEAQPETAPAETVVPRFSETAGPTTSLVDSNFDDDRNYRWIFTNGKWVRVDQRTDAATSPSGDGTVTYAPESPDITQEITDPFDWERLEPSDGTRIIAISLDALRRGEQNIIVREHDVIQVPVLKVGEFYIKGEVLRPGVYSLTGRQITVKMAIAAAGNLGPLAWPENALLIRRVGPNQEQMIPLDIEAIFRGEAADLFLKPDDMIAVGSNWRTPFLAVLRNAFRATYGFGFIYDRNFSSAAPRGLNSERFSRW